VDPAEFIRSHGGRYLMPAVRLPVVAEDNFKLKARLGRRLAISKSVPFLKVEFLEEKGSHSWDTLSDRALAIDRTEFAI
jgi:hypothetical protein